MDFLHTDFWGGPESTAVITLNAQCNVLLLDDTNFSAYQRGEGFRYYGGWATSSPVYLQPPHHAHWHVVVDLGGGAGSVKAGIRIVKHTAIV
ncbi:MAG: DUF1883 domain-containing protein, partial [Candidatus Brocadiia bacterium]